MDEERKHSKSLVQKNILKVKKKNVPIAFRCSFDSCESTTFHVVDQIHHVDFHHLEDIVAMSQELEFPRELSLVHFDDANEAAHNVALKKFFPMKSYAGISD